MTLTTITEQKEIYSRLAYHRTQWAVFYLRKNFSIPLGSGGGFRFLPGFVAPTAFPDFETEMVE